MFSRKRLNVIVFTLAFVGTEHAATRAQSPAAGQPAAGQPSAGPSSGAQAGDKSQAALIRDPDAEAAYDEAVKLLDDQKYKDAINSLNKAVGIDGTYTEAYVAKGKALQAIEDYQSAAQAYTRAIELNANLPDAFNGRGECQMELNQTELALNDFYNALELDRNNPAVLSNLGHILVNNQSSQAQADPTTAMRFLDDAIALNEKDARAYRDRGLAHAQLREFTESEADLKKAAEIDPNDYENYSTLATIYMFQDDPAPAVDAISKAIDAYKPKKRLDPKKFISGYMMRSDSRLKLAGKEDDADKRKPLLKAVVEDTDAVLADYPDRFPDSGYAFYRKGKAQRMLEEYANAVDSLTRAIQIVPAGQDVAYVADAYLFRGICFHYIGSEDLARGDFQQASATGSGFTDPRVYLWIGFTYHLQGDYRQAIDYYSQAIAKDPTFALAHVNRGRAYMDIKDYAKAIESFNNAVRAKPNVGEYYYDVGYAYMQLGEFKKAVEFLDLALLKNDPTAKMYRAMSASLRKLGRNELAAEYDRKADDADKKKPSGNQTAASDSKSDSASPAASAK